MKYVGNKLPLLVRAILPFCTQKMKCRLVKNYGFYEDEKVLEERERRHRECEHGKCLSIVEKKPKKTLEEIEEFYSGYEQKSYGIILDSIGKTVDELKVIKEKNMEIEKANKSRAEELFTNRCDLYIGKYKDYDESEFIDADNIYMKELNIINEGDEKITMRDDCFKI